ncbi:MAG: ferritin-like domain-containing protein [Nanoarchaeota archaeon]|nr:ferritin-like domain-containing protein [Nanoarchaeota archaeon]
MVEEILKQVLKQEFEAEKRYTQQINRINNPTIRKILLELRGEEIEHKDECIERLKELGNNFDASEFKDDLEIKTPLEEDDIDEIVKMLELDTEKEREAARLYTGYSNEVNNLEISTLLVKFKEDEIHHAEKIQNLIEQLKA